MIDRPLLVSARPSNLAVYAAACSVNLQTSKPFCPFLLSSNLARCLLFLFRVCLPSPLLAKRVILDERCLIVTLSFVYVLYGVCTRSSAGMEPEQSTNRLASCLFESRVPVDRAVAIREATLLVHQGNN